MSVHPLYEKSRQEWLKYQSTAYPDRSVYLTTAEVAGLIRQALKKQFPSVKFSVRSSVYSGGSSIDVRWTDGPDPDCVEAIAKAFEFANFDGMIDLKTYKRHWLLPDGTLTFASTPGTEGSGGVFPREERPAPVEGIKVSGGPDYVFCNRRVSAPAFCHVKHDRIPWGGPCPACGVSAAA